MLIAATPTRKAVQTSTSHAFGADSVARFVRNRYKTLDVFVVYDTIYTDSVVVNAFRNSTAWFATSKPAYLKHTHLEKQLVRPSVIFVPTTSERKFLSLLSKIKLLTEAPELVIIGTSSFATFENVALESWEKYNIHYVSSNKINYKKAGVDKFLKEYRSAYFKEPSFYAYWGFDEAVLISNQLVNHGVNFMHPRNELRYNGLHGDYNLTWDKTCWNRVNKSLQIYRITDGKLQQVRP